MGYFKYLIPIILCTFLTLDRRAAFQIMVSSPIFIGAIIGFYFSDIKSGILIGCAIQLLWLNKLPVGAVLTPDESIAGSVAILIYFILSEINKVPSNSYGLILFSIIYSAFCGIFSIKIDGVLRQFNAYLMRTAEKLVMQNRLSDVGLINFYSLLILFSVNLISIIVFVASGCFIINYVVKIFPESFYKAFEISFKGLFIIGISSALAAFNIKKWFYIFSISFLVSFIIFGLFT